MFEKLFEGNKEPSKEREIITPSIRLEFFRHDERGPMTEGQTDDRPVMLSQKGREHAAGIGKTKDPQPEVGIAYGSPRVRSRETALRSLLTNEEDIIPADSYEDIEKKIGQYFKARKLTARKDYTDERLNFNFDGTETFGNIFSDHYRNSKDALRFMFEESDDLVRKLGDKESTCYSRLAGNVAELVQKYLRILPVWQRITEKEPEKYIEYKNELQRFLGSHQTITESFLLKIIEKIEGREVARNFIESLPNKNGFDYSEGFTVILLPSKEGKEPMIEVRYKDKHWEITPELIEAIIEDKRKLMNSQD